MGDKVVIDQEISSNSNIVIAFSEIELGKLSVAAQFRYSTSSTVRIRCLSRIMTSLARVYPGSWPLCRFDYV